MQPHPHPPTLNGGSGLKKTALKMTGRYALLNESQQVHSPVSTEEAGTELHQQMEPQGVGGV